MSELVRTQAARDGAWQRVQLNAPPGNLLSLDLIRALGHVIHDLESMSCIKGSPSKAPALSSRLVARIQEHEPGQMATVLPETHRVMKQILAFQRRPRRW